MRSCVTHSNRPINALLFLAAGAVQDRIKLTTTCSILTQHHMIGYFLNAKQSCITAEQVQRQQVCAPEFPISLCRMQATNSSGENGWLPLEWDPFQSR